MGQPKALLKIHDQPILAYLHEQIAWPGPTLLVTAPGLEHPPGAELFTAEATDAVADQGPLCGVLTALQHASTPITVITTVDMPNVRREHLDWLIARLLVQPERLGVMAFCNTRSAEGAGRVEPFPLACRREAAEIISQRLAAGPRSVHALSQLPVFSAEPAPSDWHADIWLNLNFREDVEAFTAASSAGAWQRREGTP